MLGTTRSNLDFARGAWGPKTADLQMGKQAAFRYLFWQELVEDPKPQLKAASEPQSKPG